MKIKMGCHQQTHLFQLPKWFIQNIVGLIQIKNRVAESSEPRGTSSHNK